MPRHGSLRASDADREQVVARLHAAATEGRLDSDELGQRVQAALRARTYADLDATVADLPGPRDQRRRRAPTRRTAGARALSTARAHPVAVLVALPFIAAIAAMVLAVTVTWMVLACVVLLLGGRARVIGPRRAMWVHGRRGPRGYWA